MIVSFSVPEMKPMIKAGLRQRAGDDIGAERVKRQTIRRRGPRAEQLLERAKDAGDTIPYDLHLWWKSRTAEREWLGTASIDASVPNRVYPIEILHSSVKPVRELEYQCLRIVLPRSWEWKAEGRSHVMFWSPGEADNNFARFARADGFASTEAFRDFFVPSRGDRFNGILYEW